MNFLRVLKISCFCFLLNSAIYAADFSDSLSCQTACCPTVVVPEEAQLHFGTSTFSGTPDIWYNIDTNSYPETVFLSKNRNRGLSEGGVYLSPTGFTIGEAGNYWVTITAILQNPTEDSTVLIPVFLVIDEVLNPDDVSPIGGVVTLESGKINTLQGTGILKNVTPGTRLSLVATNAGYPFPVPVTVVSWSISLTKMP